MSRGRTLLAGLVVAVAMLAIAGNAGAQVYHSYPGADAVTDVAPEAGAVLGLGDDVVRLLGYARFNASAESDFGFEVLLDNVDTGAFGSDDGLRFGAAADFKYMIIPTDTDLPFDLAVNAGFGFQTGSDVTNFNIPVGSIISRPIELNNGRQLKPYGGLYLMVTHISIDLPPQAQGDADDTDIDVELRLGTSLELTDAASAFVALHVGDFDSFYLGANFEL